METLYRKIMDENLKDEEYREWLEKEFVAHLTSTHRHITGLLGDLGVDPSATTFTGKRLNEMMEAITRIASSSPPSTQERNMWYKQLFGMLRDYHLNIEVLIKNI